MPRPAALSTVLFAAALIVSAGCGSGEKEAPSACMNGPGPYLKAVAGAPAHARLAGGVKISDCLTPTQSGGQLSSVGGAMVRAATALNVSARRHPGASVGFGLGYLVGAAEKAADANNGIDADLIRRLRFGAEFSPDGSLPHGLRAKYERGIAAGRHRG
jgi:hypothetical protein